MKLGIIGGTGIYDISAESTALSVDTPFGAPSDQIIHFVSGEREIFFLPRHGKGHRILPSEINHRANIFALKQLGVEEVIGLSAVGSLREDIRRGDIVIPDQYFDRTKASSRHTFFGNGLVAHVGLADPVCRRLSSQVYRLIKNILANSGSDNRPRLHLGGCYVNIEGPAFSTRAESLVYRRLQFDVIGMTSLAEAKLSREAEMCYTCIATVTDYDTWHSSEQEVSVEEVMRVLEANARLSQEIITSLAHDLPAPDDACPCRHALQNAILTDPERIPPDVRRALAPIIGRYLPS